MPHRYYEIFYIETERQTYCEAKTEVINSINTDADGHKESLFWL